MLGTTAWKIHLELLFQAGGMDESNSDEGVPLMNYHSHTVYFDLQRQFKYGSAGIELSLDHSA